MGPNVPIGTIRRTPSGPSNVPSRIQHLSVYLGVLVYLPKLLFGCQTNCQHPREIGRSPGPMSLKDFMGRPLERPLRPTLALNFWWLCPPTKIPGSLADMLFGGQTKAGVLDLQFIMQTAVIFAMSDFKFAPPQTHSSTLSQTSSSF